MVAQQVSHPRYGRGVIQSGGLHTRYTTVRFGTTTMTVPSSELAPVTVLEPALFMGGDRVALRDRQGTVKSVDAAQIHIAWDSGLESYLVPYQEGLTLLPPLPSGTPVKHKGTTHVGKIINTPSRGDTHVGVLWNSGHSSTVKLETMAPTSPQKPQDGKRTVDDALAEIRTEIAKWRTVGDEAEEKIRVLTEQATVLLNAKRHAALVQSIEKW